MLFCIGCNSIATRTISIKSHTQSAKISISYNHVDCLVEVKDEFGIGRMNVSRIHQEWPEKLIIRLYLKGLEGLSVRNAKFKLEKSNLTVIHEPLKSYYELQLPKSILTDDCENLEIQWVDFYR